MKKIGITNLIPENIAPANVEELVLFKDDVKIGKIDFSKISQTNLGEKLYSFGLVSDIHLWGSDPAWDANNKFDNTLSYFESKKYPFCIVTGDLT